MTNKQFYQRLAKEIFENTHPEAQEHVANLQITSLEQVLGIVRSIMIKNNRQVDDVNYLKLELKRMRDVLGLTEKDL